MKRLFLVLLALCSALAFSEETYIGLYMNGAKIGYGSSNETTETLNGKTVKRSDSLNVINASMLGSSMSMKISSTSWFTMDGKPIRMKMLSESAGRTQLIDAIFTSTSIKISSDNSGQKTTKTIPMPTDAPIMADSMLPSIGDATSSLKH